MLTSSITVLETGGAATNVAAETKYTLRSSIRDLVVVLTNNIIVPTSGIEVLNSSIIVLTSSVLVLTRCTIVLTSADEASPAVLETGGAAANVAAGTKYTIAAQLQLSSCSSAD